MSRRSLLAALNISPLAALIQPMITSGQLQIHESVPENKALDPLAHAASTDSGHIHLFASNIHPRHVDAVILHEAFHKAPDCLTNSRAWRRLNHRLEEIYREASDSANPAHPIWTRAKDRVDLAVARGAHGEKIDRISEFGAYAIEEYERAPRSLRRWVNNAAGTVKAWGLKNLGVQMGAVSPAQLRALARYSLRHQASAWAPGAVPTFSSPQYSLAFHGTPYEFDSFCLSELPDRSVDQTFGHGHYFSGTLGIAEDYAALDLRPSSRSPLFVNGTKVNPGEPEHDAALLVNRTTLQCARTVAEEWLTDAQAGADYTRSKGISWYQAVHDTLQSLESADDISKGPGRVVVVDIPDDDHLLDYDLPLADQPAFVRDALGLTNVAPAEVFPCGNDTWGVRNTATGAVLTTNWANKATAERIAAFGDRGEQGMTGRELYLQKTNELGSKEKASEYFAQRGIKGLRYADGYTRDGETEKRNFNYVIWNDDAIDVTGVMECSETPSESIQQSIESSLFESVGQADADVYTTLRGLEKAFSQYRLAVRDAFDQIAYFYTDSSHPALASRARIAVRRQDGHALKDRLVREYGEDFGGLELANEGRTQFAIFLNDAAEPGRVRYQIFDRQGFTRHRTFDTYEEALSDAIEDGFRALAKGALEAVMASPDFVRGNALASNIAKFNAGQITMEQVYEGLPPGGPRYGGRPDSEVYLSSSASLDVFLRRETGRPDVAVVVTGDQPDSAIEMPVAQLLRLEKSGGLSEPLTTAAKAISALGYGKPPKIREKDFQAFADRSVGSAPSR